MAARLAQPLRYIQIGNLEKLAKWQFVYIVGWDLSPTFYWWHAFIINVGLKSNTPIAFAPQIPICEGIRVFRDSQIKKPQIV